MDDGGFEAFVAAHAPSLLRTAYLLTGDRAQARDLLHSALIATYRHRADVGDPLAHSRRALVRAATGWGRRIRVGDLLAESQLLAGTRGLPGFGTTVRSDPGPRTELTEALARLPARERVALVLRYGDDGSEAAAAEALGAPADEVRGLLEVGLARLGELLPGGIPVERLRAEFAARGGEVSADPAETLAAVREGASSQRGHLVGLAVLAAFVVLVVVLVALTV